jgi:hypothetical protein
VGAENPKADWFALFADDGTIDDNTLCNHVRRGEFRLHPRHIGISQGCIIDSQDFNRCIAEKPDSMYKSNGICEDYNLLDSPRTDV